MSNLKELTWENHKRAERKGFAKTLMSGKISPELYYTYLINQQANYVCLEAVARNFLPVDLHGVFRADAILEDILELESLHGLKYDSAQMKRSTGNYVDYVYRVMSFTTPEYQKKLLLPHMYVRHFGDMYGGAMIQKRVPGSGKMYEFENKEYLKNGMRALLTDDMADDANLCFDFAITLFEELEE